MTQTTITLNNGVEMPVLGIGVFQIPDGPDTYNAVLSALKCGYRKIDTAHAYQNEVSVGKAIKDSGIPRNELWVTSKLWISDYGEEKSLEALDKMLKRLGLDYLDLLYLHQPFGDYLGAYKAVEKAYAQKKIRAIGISDFDYTEELLSTFLEQATIKPQCLQMELQPYAQRLPCRAICDKYGVKVECWYPFGGRVSQGSILQDPVLQSVAAAHKKSVAQVILRFDIQEGLSIIPGSTNPQHISDNLNVFDFTLTEEEMKKIRGLNKEQRVHALSYEESMKLCTSFTLPE